MRYFEAFPTIDYNDQKIKNLLTRVKFLEAAKTSASVYHPFTILDGESPAKIAYDYYDSTDYQWIIFLLNDIVDPYHDWPLDTYDFEEHVKAKYGSLAQAQSTILHYVKVPDEYLVNLNDPNDYHLASTFSGDSSGYKLIQDDKEIRISPETYAQNPDDAFQPVDAYTYEMARNETKRNIKLLDRSFTRSIENELKEILKN